MIKLLTCSRQHCWQEKPPVDPSAAPASPSCPVCGEPAVEDRFDEWGDPIDDQARTEADISGTAFPAVSPAGPPAQQPPSDLRDDDSGLTLGGSGLAGGRSGPAENDTTSGDLVPADRGPTRPGTLPLLDQTFIPSSPGPKSDSWPDIGTWADASFPPGPLPVEKPGSVLRTSPTPADAPRPTAEPPTARATPSAPAGNPHADDSGKFLTDTFNARFPARPDPGQFQSTLVPAVPATPAVPAVSASSTRQVAVVPMKQAPAVRVPGYEILGELGRGAMGVVYKARQSGLNRIVALKMILAAGHAGAEDLERFRLEAEAVARIEHPNIVQIFDVGEHDGHPYCALEFLEGGTLQQKFKGEPQPARTAAAVIEALALGIDQAHRAKIIHRDLKPANVMLSTDGTPKITDFGLAKKIEGDQGQTASGMVLGTPTYMAPEQAAGRTNELGPATDIYALGAMLYEALTGRVPIRGETVLDTMLMVQTQDPLPPSRLIPKLPRDLETICLTCLHKTPARRYPSARDLAADLRRFLDGEPILARQVSAWEQAVKWVRRNPARAALIGSGGFATVALAVASVAFAGYSDGQRRIAADHEATKVEEKARAERAARQAEKAEAEAKAQENRASKTKDLLVATARTSRSAVDRVFTDLGYAGLKGQKWMEEVRRDLLQTGKQYYKQLGPLDTEYAGGALLSLGVVNELLGDKKAAENAYAEALEVLRPKSPADSPDDFRADALARLQANRGNLFQNEGEKDKSAAAYQDAIERKRKLLRANRADPERDAELARTLLNYGKLLRDQGKFVDAENNYRAAKETWDDLAQKHPDNPAFALEYGRTLNALAELTRRRATTKDDGAEADALHKQALKLFRTATAVGTFYRGDYREELGVTLNHLGNLWRDKNQPAAKQYYEQAVRLQREQVVDFPAVPEYRKQLAQSLRNLGILLRQAGKTAEAEAAEGEARRILERLVRDFPDTPDFLIDLAKEHDGQAFGRQQAGNLAAAEAEYRAAIDAYSRLMRADPADVRYRDGLAATQQNLGSMLLRAERFPEAVRAYQKAVEARKGAPGEERTLQTRRDTAESLGSLGVALLRSGNVPDAAARMKETLDELTEMVKLDSKNPEYQILRASALQNYALLARSTKDVERAEKAARDAVDAWAELVKEQPSTPGHRQKQASALHGLADVLNARGKPDDALELRRRAAEIQDDLIGKFPGELDYRHDLAKSHLRLAAAYFHAKRYDKTLASLRVTEAMFGDLIAASPSTPGFETGFADAVANEAKILRATGFLREAEEAWQRLVEFQEKRRRARPTEPRPRLDLAVSLNGLAGVHLRQRSPSRAAPVFERVVALLDAESPASEAATAQLLKARVGLAQAYADLKKHGAAAGLLTNVYESTPRQWLKGIDAAVALAKCVEVVGDDRGLPEVQRGALADRYGALAVAFLRKGIAAGFKNYQALRQSPDLRSIRDRADFQKLVPPDGAK